MALWDKVKEGIDKAGKVAQGAIDEGKLRIDAYRAREQADKAAEALGYAVFRATESGLDLDSSARETLLSAIREREKQAVKLEAELAAARAGSTSESSASTDSASSNQGDSASSAPSEPPSN